jgi:adenine-specific DNA-methyltransferase
VLICFGPEHAPLEQRTVELAIGEAQNLKPAAQMILFCAFQFDEEAAKDIDETNENLIGFKLLKVQMNADLLTDDLRKKRSSNDSFWLIGQPDVEMASVEWLVTSNRRVLCSYEYFKIVSGLDSLAKINRLEPEDILLYAAISQRRDIWDNSADAKSSRFNSEQHSGRSRTQFDGRISPISGNFQRFFVRVGDTIDHLAKSGVSFRRDIAKVVKRLRGDKQIAQWANEITSHIIDETKESSHSPLITQRYSQVEVHGFDYYDPKNGKVTSGGKNDIAMWMLDTDYDGRSLYPSQVFFPMSGSKDGWSKLAKNLKAELDEQKIESFKGTVSLPFTAGKNVAVKIIDARGIESLKILK